MNSERVKSQSQRPSNFQLSEKTKVCNAKAKPVRQQNQKKKRKIRNILKLRRIFIDHLLNLDIYSQTEMHNL